MGKDNGNNHKSNTLEMKRTFNPHRQAMLQALRVVLDMPRKPIVFAEEDKTSSLAILPRKSDVCTLTARTRPEVMEQEHEGASGQEER